MEIMRTGFLGAGKLAHCFTKALLRTGFIGAGQMMQAIGNGITSADLVKAEKIIASDVSDVMLDSIKLLGVVASKNNRDVVSKSDLIILAVKPDVVSSVLKEIKDLMTPDKLLVSIAAGVKIKTLQDALPSGTRIIRVMPNTPALVQAGAAYIAPASTATKSDIDCVCSIFNSVGICEVGSEDLLNAVTGLSGSGPAYVYAAIEALSDGGVKMGLPRATALRLAAQTCMGAAKMVLETGKHPGELKDAVCSPGGTTIAGVHRLERSSFRAGLMDAVEAGALRAAELGDKN